MSRSDPAKISTEMFILEMEQNCGVCVLKFETFLKRKSRTLVELVLKILINFIRFIFNREVKSLFI